MYSLYQGVRGNRTHCKRRHIFNKKANHKLPKVNKFEHFYGGPWLQWGGWSPSEQVWTDPQWPHRNPPCEQTHATENITFSQLPWQAITSEELKLKFRISIIMNEFYCLKPANLQMNRILTKKLILVTRSKHLHLCLYFYSFYGCRLQRSLCYQL